MRHAVRNVTHSHHWLPLLLAVTLLLAVACDSRDNSAVLGALQLNPAQVDFGTLIAGEEASATLTLTNSAPDRALHIKEIRPSCGCTATRLDNNTLAPGKSATLTLGFNSQGRKGEQLLAVRILTDDPVQPVIHLKLTAIVKEAASLNPAAMRFDPVRLGETRSARVDIVMPEGASVTLGEPAVRMPGLSARIVEDGGKKALELSYRPQRIGRQQGMLRLPTGKAGRAYVELPIIAEVVGPIAVQPSRVSLYRNQPSFAPVKVRLYCEQNAIKLLGTTEKSGKLVVQTHQIDPKSVELSVSLKPEFANEANSFSTAIQLTTDHPDQATIAIPVSYHARHERP